MTFPPANGHTGERVNGQTGERADGQTDKRIGRAASPGRVALAVFCFWSPLSARLEHSPLADEIHDPAIWRV